MDFIHKIIADRRAARVMASLPPVDLMAEAPPAPLSLDQAQRIDAEAMEARDAPEFVNEAFADEASHSEAGSRPRALIAPAWTNPNAADIRAGLLVAQDEPEPIADAPELEAETLAADASEPVAEAMAQPLAVAPQVPPTRASVSTFSGWDRPQPLRSSLLMEKTVPLFAAPASAPAEPAPIPMTAAAAAFSAPAEPAPSIAPGASFAARPTDVESQPDLAEMPYVSARGTRRQTSVLNDAGIQMPAPAAGRGASRSGHVKTRMLGFNPETLGVADPFEKRANASDNNFPVGWLVVVGGPGLGGCFVLRDGVARIGRGEDQEICLNFGDNAISRENHVSVAFDSEQNAFFIGQSGKGNIVRLNNKPLLSTEQIRSGDQIRIGETTLRFAALCGQDFAWAQKV